MQENEKSLSIESNTFKLQLDEISKPIGFYATTNILFSQIVRKNSKSWVGHLQSENRRPASPPSYERPDQSGMKFQRNRSLWTVLSRNRSTVLRFFQRLPIYLLKGSATNKWKQKTFEMKIIYTKIQDIKIRRVVIRISTRITYTRNCHKLQLNSK